MSDTPNHLLRALEFLTSPQPPRIEMLAAVRKVHANRAYDLLEDPNIVGIGISEKVVETKPIGELALCFYVKKKKPASKVRPDCLIPPVLALAEPLPVFTDVKVLGEVRPENKVNAQRRPIVSGYSVGHYRVTAGTIAAIVKKGEGSFILSNSHVLADSGRGKQGDPILYPGDEDGGKRPADKVAELTKFVPFVRGGGFVNRVDAAIARIVEDRLGDVSYAVQGAKMPLGMIAPERGMKVVKRGRTTGTTKSKILDIHFRVALQYPGVGKIGFLDQVLCERYTDGGDSGSLVVDSKSGKVVGLHFAGADAGSVFNPMTEVTKALGFRFVSV